MEMRMTWKATSAQHELRSPSPPPVEWLDEGQITTALADHNEKVKAHKRRRQDGSRQITYTSHRTPSGPNGAMDALSSVALEYGTSPYGHRRGASAHSGAGMMDERPSKRVKSERFHSTTDARDNPRPTTSYTRPAPSLAPETSMQDAELLLNFFNFARATPTKPSPTTSHTRSVSFGQSPTFIDRPAHAVSHEPLPQYQSTQAVPFPEPEHMHHGAEVPSDGPRSTPVEAHLIQEEAQRRNNAARELNGQYTPHVDGSMAPPATPRANFDNVNASSTMPMDVDPPTEAETVPVNEMSRPVGTSEGPQERSNVDNIRAAEPANADGTTAQASMAQQDQPTAEDESEVPPVKPEESIQAGSTVGSLPLDDAASAGQQKLEEQKRREITEQICAACGFNRNKLTLETENESTSWISCDGCNKWFHFACAGFKSEREVRSVDKYRCKTCKPLYGPTTYTRKSARAHAPIDYAELNQGVVKTSEESPEHHYIGPIKEGSIKFTPETFARIRPELITTDFWMRGDGTREPVVIPAEWNPQPRRIPNPEGADEDTEEDPAADNVLHDQSALDSDVAQEFEYEQEPDEGQDALDMVIPRDLTVRRVAELYGPEEKLEVIDVKSQNGEDKRWNMRKWADYYESDAPNKPVRNVISLEVSQSRLGRLIRRPKVVRDLDLQDSIWPQDLMARGDYPKVQFYCLMSVADCYTDFHIDFGGSSVYYHIIKGKKTFFFIPPTETNLKKYEDWCNSEAQNYTFLGDQTKVCYRVDLGPGDTMLIPAGWIHAVWTPEDSLVIGGNFLTRQNFAMQIRITQIEKATGVARKFRYPSFQKVMWYTVIKYLTEDPIPQSVMDILLSGQKYDRDVQTWEEFDAWGQEAVSGPGTERYHARYYPKCELEGLPELARYVQRTAYIAAGYVTDGVSSDTKRAVTRSIPKEHKQHGNEPVDCVRKFAMWYCWKRGNELLPHWAYPDYVPETNAPEVTQKKLSAAHIRRLEREAAMSAERVSDRPQRERKQPSNLYNEMMTEQEKAEKARAMKASSPSADTPTMAEPSPEAVKPAVESPSSKKDAQPKKRKSSGGAVNRQPACEACRKGRRACKHRDLPPAEVPPAPMYTTEFDKMDGVESDPYSGIFAVNHPYPQIPAGHVLQSGQAAVPEAHTNVDGGATTLATPSKDGSASGRSKACADCRKSKRRCIHDEFGRQDPVKMAQAAQPRPAAKKKRPSDATTETPQIKKPKKTSSPGQAQSSFDMHIDDALLAGSVAPMAPMAPMMTAMVASATQQPTPVMPSEPMFQADDEAGYVADPMGLDNIDPALKGEPATVPSSMPQDNSSALVSPPESTHTDNERTASPAHLPRPTVEGADDAHKGRDLTPPTTASAPRSRRSSQLALKALVGNSPEIERSRAMSTASSDSNKVLDAMIKRRASSHTLNEVDEESLRLIKDLAAQDRGLRRRESRPA